MTRIKNHKTFFFSLLYIAIIFSLSTCKGDDTTEDFQIDFGYEYLPLEIGKYITYQVDSVIYDVGASEFLVDSSRTFMKEVLFDTLSDNLGRLTYLLQRFERFDESETWQLRDVWSVVRTLTQLEKVEENLRFIKMIFPLKENVEWDGNTFIDKSTIFSIAGESIEIFKDWNYQILTVDQSEKIGAYDFDKVTTISQADSENLIERRYSVEKYAENVGLVYREMKILDTQEIDESKPWEEKAQKGYIIRQVVLDYN